MKITSKFDAQQKNRLKWFGKGAAVIAIAVCAFAFFSVVNMWISFESSANNPNWFVDIFLINTLKCVAIIIPASLFWYFLSVQEYKTAFDDLFELFADDDMEGEGDIENPYSSNTGIDTLVESANQVMRKNSLYKTGIDTLVESANEVIQKNRIYKTKLEVQQELILENFMMRLMRGRIQDISSAYEQADALGLDLRGTSVQVLMFQTENGEEQPVYDDFKEQLVEKLGVAFDGYTVEVDGMLACLILPRGNRDLRSAECATEIKRMAIQILNVMLNRYDAPARLAMASGDIGISGIEKSFSEAIELFQCADITGETDCLLTCNASNHLNMADADDYFWVKKEMQFMNCISATDYQSASVLFYEILDSDYLRNELPLKLLNCRMLGLINSMINALGKIQVSMDATFFEELEPLEKILNCTSIPELRKYATEVFDAINQYHENQKKQTPYEKIEQIVGYTKENFSNPNLSVASIADEFEINVSYLSRTFKKMMGIGLAEFLQRIRVEKASELMKQGDLTVKEVSELVGYSSVLTMNRAFKKFEGITAGKLRGNERGAVTASVTDSAL